MHWIKQKRELSMKALEFSLIWETDILDTILLLQSPTNIIIARAVFSEESQVSTLDAAEISLHLK